MNAPLISGGEPVKSVIALSDADMAAVQQLKNAGFGSERGGSLDAILQLRRRQGPTKQARYETMRDAAQWLIQSNDKRWASHVAKFKNSLSSRDVHTDGIISTLSVQYGNDAYIGETLMPAITTPEKSGSFRTYNKRDRLAAGNDDSDLVADDGDITEIKDTRSTDTFLCETRGKKNKIGATAVSNQDAVLNELFDLSESLFEQRALAREKRIATVMTTAGNYATGNKATLAGADQWNSASGGNPIKNIQDAKAALWMGRGQGRTLAFSDLNIFNVLSRHADILGLFLYSGNPIGLATPGLIARFFGLDDYLVGAAREDTANEGQTASYSRIWGDYFGLARVMNRASLRNVAFGCTMRWTMPGVKGSNGGIVTGQWYEDSKGLGGCYYAKAGESEHHKVIANDAGYLYSDVLA
jgi:hypothetical protein